MRLPLDETDYSDFEDFHHVLMLQPTNDIESLQALMALGGSWKDFRDFVFSIVNPIMEDIEANGLPAEVEHLLHQALEEYSKDRDPAAETGRPECEQRNMHDAQSKVNEATAIVEVFTQLDERRVLRSRAALSWIQFAFNRTKVLSTNDEGFALFVAYEALSLWLFQIKRSSSSLSIDGQLYRLVSKRRKSRAHHLLNALHLRKRQADNRTRKRDCVSAADLRCLHRALTWLAESSEPCASRVWVASLSKQHYLEKSSPFGEPASGENQNHVSLLNSLHQACGKIQNAGLRKIVEVPLNGFADYIAGGGALAVLKGAKPTPESRRSQYGHDFYQTVERLKPDILEECDKKDSPRLNSVLDSWLTMPLRGRDDRHTTDKSGNRIDRLTFARMKALRQLSIKNCIPVIADIAADTRQHAM